MDDFLVKKNIKNLFFMVVNSLPIMAKKRKKVSKENWENILVFQLDMLGDMMMTTPFLECLRKNFPLSKISVVYTPQATPVLNNSRVVNDKFSYLAFWEDRAVTFFPGIKHINSTIKLLMWFKKRKFDVCFVLNHREQPLVTWLATFSNAPTRIGFFQGKGDRYLTDGIRPESRRHYVQENLNLLSLVGICVDQSETRMRFICSQASIDNIKNWLSEWCIGPLICIAPCSTQEQKKWKKSAWIIVANYLLDKGYSIVFSGATNEKDYVEEIRQGVVNCNKTRNIAGLFDFEEYGALLGFSKLLISLDSASVHLADALNVPVMILWSGYYNVNKLLPNHSLSLSINSNPLISQKDGGYHSHYMAFNISKLLGSLGDFLTELNNKNVPKIIKVNSGMEKD